MGAEPDHNMLGHCTPCSHYLTVSSFYIFFQTPLHVAAFKMPLAHCLMFATVDTQFIHFHWLLSPTVRHLQSLLHVGIVMGCVNPPGFAMGSTMGMGVGRHSATHAKPLPQSWVLWVTSQSGALGIVR